MKKILVVDDTLEIRELLKKYLKNAGFEVIEAEDGIEALEHMYNNEDIDLALVDIMMPDMDGISFVKRIRKKSHIPIIFLTAKSEDIDKIFGLQIGADDYISKPFNPLEVISRIQALLRRVEQYSSNKIESIKILEVGKLKLDTISCILYNNDMPLEITHYEYKMLYLFMKNPGVVFTKKQIYEFVWNEEYLDNENIIMVYISKLRDKIENDSKDPIYLKTIRGLGYRFEKI